MPKKNSSITIPINGLRPLKNLGKNPIVIPIRIDSNVGMNFKPRIGFNFFLEIPIHSR